MFDRFVRGPLPCTGSRYSILYQIMQYLPGHCGTFIDLFGGPFDVGVNVHADTAVYNGMEPHICGIMDYFNTHDTDRVVYDIRSNIIWYDLSSYRNAYAGYHELCRDYNNGYNSPDVLYTLSCYSADNAISFGQNGEFNVPFGRGGFNMRTRTNLIKFLDAMHSKNIQVINMDFSRFDISQYVDDVVVYCDLPCSGPGTAEQLDTFEQLALLKRLEEWNGIGIRWAVLSNMNYGNHVLSQWTQQYGFIVHRLGNTCNAARESGLMPDEMVVVANF